MRKKGKGTVARDERAADGPKGVAILKEVVLGRENTRELFKVFH